jgi:heme-degrading monooxygenase HmoA
MVKVVLEHRTKSRENTKTLVKLIKHIRAQARQQHGFITGETLVDTEDPCHVIVISTWQTQEDWKAWDASDTRAATRPHIEELLVEPFNAVILPVPVVWREDLVNVF